MALVSDIFNYFSLRKAQEEQAKMDKESIQLGKDTLDWNKQAQETQWNREDNAISRQLADARKNGINPLVALGQSGFDSSTNLLNSDSLQQSIQASGQHKVDYAQMKFQNAMSVFNATVGTMNNISKLSETVRHNKALEDGMNWINKLMNETVIPGAKKLIDNNLPNIPNLLGDGSGKSFKDDGRLHSLKDLPDSFRADKERRKKNKQREQQRKAEKSAQEHNEKSLKSKVSELEKDHGHATYHGFPDGHGGVWIFADGTRLEDRY